MAQRRMFAKKITESDAFLDMPMSSQCLYFHLAMNADDEGFVNNPKKLQRMVGATDDDVKVLLAKRFIMSFDSGVIVIKHWRMHNYIQSDRFRKTDYIEERSQLIVKDNNSYKLIGDDVEISTMYPECIQNVSKVDTQYSIDKDSINKNIVSSSPSANVDDSLSLSDEFDELWKLYPRKAGKKKAFESYKRSRKNGATFDQVKDGIQRYVDSIKANGTPKQFILMGQTFFNQERWSDEFIVEEKQKSNTIEPPKYKEFTEEEQKKDRVGMPDEVRSRLKTMFWEVQNERDNQET